MRKIIAAVFAVMMLFAIGTGTLALVAERDSEPKNPPIFIRSLVVADAWMSGLTRQNWQGALVDQTYVEGTDIWFIAAISVSAYEDTDSGQLWFNGSEEAFLSVTSQNNCLDFSSASLATFAKIKGMDVLSEQLNPVSSRLVEARYDRAVFRFSCQTLPDDPIVEHEALVFPEDLANLKIDGIFPADILGPGVHHATMQKDYYLHFKAVANAATEGVCIATLKVDDTEARRFLRDPDAQHDEEAAYLSANWWSPHDENANALLNPGDRSFIYRIDNTVNNKVYSMMKLSGRAVENNSGHEAPFRNTSSIYVIMNEGATECYVGFAVAGTRLQGLVYWDINYRGYRLPGLFSRDGGAGGDNRLTQDAANYSPLIENNSGNDLTRIGRNIGIDAAELRAIFSYFGIARTNPGAVDDATFLAPGTGRAGASRTARETSAEARYNVSSGNQELDDLFVTENPYLEPPPSPSPAPSPELTLPRLPLDIAKPPEPTASPSPSPSPGA